MNQIKNTKSILDSKSDVVALRMFFVLVFVLMSCSGVFGQTVNTEVAGSDIRSEVSAKESKASQMELVKWFMGSRQSTPATKTESATKTTTKKQIIDAGMTPNRILSRTLLKKAMDFESNVA